VHPMERWGWNEWVLYNWNAPIGTGVIGRVIGTYSGRYRIGLAEGAECWAVLAGRLQQYDLGRTGAVTGDWVLLLGSGTPELAIIEDLAPRRTWLARKDPSRPGGRQDLAAHVDTAFVVTALNRELNLRRMERLLSIVWDGGVEPVILLNKIDLAAGQTGLDQALDELKSVAAGAPILPIGARGGEGLASLDPYLSPGRSLVLLGSSGVGKSTLVNALMGGAVQDVRTLSELNDRGRHTTTAREMFRLPSGALLIDTPGIREAGLIGEEKGLRRAFRDIEELRADCRFRDCRHEREPGCAVRAAVEAGTLDSGRYASYLKLLKESAHEAAEISVAARLRRKSRDKSLAKRLRARAREKENPV